MPTQGVHKPLNLITQVITRISITIKPDIRDSKISVIGKCERKRLSISICIANTGCQHQISSRPQSYP